MTTTYEYNDEDDIDGMHDFIVQADIVEAPKSYG